MAAKEQSLLNVQSNLSSVSMNIESNIITKINRLENKIEDKINYIDFNNLDSLSLEYTNTEIRYFYYPSDFSPLIDYETYKKINILDNNSNIVSGLTSMFSNGIGKNAWKIGINNREVNYVPITNQKVDILSSLNLMSIDKFSNYILNIKLNVKSTKDSVASLMFGINVIKDKLKLYYLDFDDDKPIIKSENEKINTNSGKLSKGIHDIKLITYHNQLLVVVDNESYIIKKDVNLTGFVGMLCNNNIEYYNFELNVGVKPVLEYFILKGNELTGVYEKVKEFNKCLNMLPERVHCFFYNIPNTDFYIFEAYNYPTMYQFRNSERSVPLKRTYSLIFTSTLFTSIASGIVNQWSIADDGLIDWNEQLNTWITTKFEDWKVPLNGKSKGIVLYTNNNEDIPNAIKDKMNLSDISLLDSKTENYYFTIYRQQGFAGFNWSANFINIKDPSYTKVYSFKSSDETFDKVPINITDVKLVNSVVSIFSLKDTNKEKFNEYFSSISENKNIPELSGMKRYEYNTRLLKNPITVTNGLNGIGQTEYAAVKFNRFGGYNKIIDQFNSYSTVSLIPFDALTVVLEFTSKQSIYKQKEIEEIKNNPNFVIEDDSTWSEEYNKSVQDLELSRIKFSNFIDNPINQVSISWYGGSNPDLSLDDPNKNDISLVNKLCLNEKISKFGTVNELSTKYKVIHDNIILLVPGVSENLGRGQHTWSLNNDIGVPTWRDNYFTNPNDGSNSTPTKRTGDKNIDRFLGMLLLRTNSLAATPPNSDQIYNYISEVESLNLLEITLVEVKENKIVEATSEEVINNWNENIKPNLQL